MIEAIAMKRYAMAVMDRQPFTVGDWKVEPELNRLSRGDEHVGLQPKVMDLLVYLSSRPGEVVTVDDLIDDVWDGIIVTSQSVYNCVTQLRHAFGEGGDQTEYIETIPKRGYRLVAPVTSLQEEQPAPTSLSSDPLPASEDAPALVTDVHEGRAAAPPERTGRLYLRPVLAAASAVFLIAGLFWLGPSPSEIEIKIPGITKPQVLPNSIAVLPFANLSPNLDDAYFAAGMHEEVLNRLSKIEDLAVIARTSVMGYAATDKPIPVIAKELNVGAVMEGSVRYAGDRVRITVQLNDAKTGVHLWSEAYDRDLSDIFAIQSDIALKITDAMKVEFSVSEQDAIAKAPTYNLGAYAHYVKALSLMGTLQSMAPAHEELDTAIALDPNFTLALATKAWLYSAELSTQLEGVEITAESQRRHAYLARNYAERALAIDPDQAAAYQSLGFVEFYERRWERVHANILKAYRLNPTNPFFTTSYAFNLIQLGRVDEAIPIIQRAFALDPRGWTHAYFAAEIMGGWGHIDTGIDYARRAIDLVPSLHYGYTMLAKLAAMNGDLETALEMAKRSEAIAAGRHEKATILHLMEAYYWLRRPDDVARLFKKLQTIGKTQTLNHGDLFQAYFALGDFETALDHLDATIEAHFPAGIGQAVGTLLATRYYEPLWGHPRYEAVLDELGVEDVFPRPKPMQGAMKRP